MVRLIHDLNIISLESLSEEESVYLYLYFGKSQFIEHFSANMLNAVSRKVFLKKRVIKSINFSILTTIFC